MEHFNLYSKRNQVLPDIYSYDPIPDKFRYQVAHLWNNQFQGGELKETRKSLFNAIESILLLEYGLPTLYNYHFSSEENVMDGLLLKSPITDRVLDVIELLCRALDKISDFETGYENARRMNADNFIQNLNFRFKENGLGYRIENTTIIKIETEVLHTNITKPVLYYLTNPAYKSINEEYLIAQEHFRHGRNKECLNECLKAFESTLKIICSKKGWHYDPQKDTSTKLIKIIIENNFIPGYFQASIPSLRAFLEGSIPTIRNRNSGHGQGKDIIIVDDNLASYCLNLTGSTIRFLIENI